MSIDQIISPQLDYSSKVYNHPSPLYVKITPLSGGTTITPQVSSVLGPVSFQIPSKVVNLARSYISFNLLLTAEALKFFNVHGNLASVFNRVTLSTVGSNVILADINNVSNYVDMVAPVATRYKDFVDKPSPFKFLPDATLSTLVKSKLTTVEDISCAYSAVNPTPINWTTGAAVASTSPSPSPYSESTLLPRYVYSSGTVSVDNYLSVRIPLSAFKFTALAIDRDLYFAGETLNLDLYFEAATKWVFTNITTAARPDTTPAAITAASLANGITDLTLNVCCEQNIICIKWFAFLCGGPIQYPYAICFTFSFSHLLRFKKK
jgi:hypothetical protein